jgi:release factor glutamine methyltransferase
LAQHEKKVTIKTHPEVYDPAEDTMLLSDNLRVEKGDRVLEIGVGYLSLIASRDAEYVVGTDTNIHAVKLAKSNARLNNTANVEFILADLFGPIGGQFDLILINPPYLPAIEKAEQRCIDSSWNGGRNGREVTDRFLKQVADRLNESGKVLIVQSSISDPNRTEEMLVEQGFEVRTIAERTFFFETLHLMEATRKK